MKFMIDDVNEKFKIEICFVNLIILFYLYRTAIPLLKFPFLLLYSCFIVYSLICYKKQIISTLREFVRNYILLFVLAILIVISFFLSNKLYLTIFKDVVSVIILFSLFFISSLAVTAKQKIDFYVSNLVYLIVLFSSLVSILRLLYVLGIFSYNDFSQINTIAGNYRSDSQSIDYNFALLPSFYGMIGVFYFLRKQYSRFQIVFYNFLLIIFSLNIILSGSRRGFFLLIIIFLFLTTVKFLSLFKRNRFLIELGSNVTFFILSLIFIPILFSIYFFHTTSSFKTKSLFTLGTKDIISEKFVISRNLYRYVSAINTKIAFSEFYNKIWTVSFDPKDPDSGWGNRIHKSVFPLKGKNVEIVPDGVIGYLIDSTSNLTYYPENDKWECYSLLANLKASKGDRYKASVYCFVSNSFNTNSAGLGVETANIKNNLVSGKVSTSYDFNNIGIWQKLELEFYCNKGEINIYFGFWKNGLKDCSNLKGYIIFAYPTFEKFKKSELGLSCIQFKTNYSEPGIIHISKNENNLKNYDLIDKIKLKKERNTSYLESRESLKLKYTILSGPYVSNSKKYSFSSIYNFPLSILIGSGLIQNGSDPIRNWAYRFISEDTTYYPYKSNIVLDTISNQFIGDRVSRWEFALKIFSKEYDWKQKFFGGGFNYLNWYGYYFDKDKTRSDYPHNPFLSILLYSGIFGLIVYLIFMYKVFYYYVKYFKEYKILAVFFIITFFFSFFSAGSPFDPPIMGFFVILPFFIHSIHIKYGDEVI